MTQKQSTSPIMPHRRAVEYAFAAVLSTVLSVMLLTSVPVHAQLEDWKLIPAPERFTALSLNDYLHIPKTVTKAIPATISFRIENHEGHRVMYRYIALQNAQSTHPTSLANGQIAVESGSSVDIPVKLAASDTTPHSEISIVLPEQQQEIHFYLGDAQ